MKIVEDAPAKLNLGLAIQGRRDDGFHDILSVFQTVDMCDRLTFAPADRGQIILSCNDPHLSVGPENLVYKATLAFQEYTGIDRGVQIALDKQIPMEAGLGGGSSDAAAVLRVLNRLWQADLSHSQLCDIGATLGSDVPFFVQKKGTAVVTGRGDLVRYIPWSVPVFYVLVYPSFKVPTGWAYANFKKVLTGSGDYAKFLNSVDFDDLSVYNLLRHIENDFLPLVAQTHPETQRILTRLKKAGALAVSMSGSGSTLYGVFESRSVAEAILTQFKTEHFRVFLCCPAV